MRVNRRREIVRAVVLAAALLCSALALPAAAQDDVFNCPVDIEVPPGEVSPNSHSSGGMAGNGWDGAGANADTIFWHIDGTTANEGAAQRQAIINALQTWANVVQITFQEVPTTNRNGSIDINWLTGDHSGTEPAEAGDPDCPFSGTNPLAHAGFPPGVNSACVNPMAETWAGNVHFNTAFTWEADNAGGSGPFSIQLIGSHEIGHAIGLTHSATGDIMQPSFSSTTAAFAPSANDIHNLQQGYAAGTGSVTTLEQTGIWVNPSSPGNSWGVVGNEFDTVSQAVNAVPAFANSVPIRISAGSYPENIVISSGQERTFTLTVNGSGNVVIGN